MTSFQVAAAIGDAIGVGLVVGVVLVLLSLLGTGRR